MIKLAGNFQLFEQQGNRVVWRNHGETLVVTPWGDDSLRVQSTKMQEVEDTRYALLDPASIGRLEIRVEETRATIRCGKLTLLMEINGWYYDLRMTFMNEKGEVLLRETDAGNALALKARKFEPQLGGDYALTVTFDGQDDERLYGMGQYQEEILDWKGCTLELAHRNSQASVPFVMSSKGYGFLWHNPAIGTVNFGKNRTTWKAEATKQMDYWITAGDRPEDISHNYARATGFAPMMPEYGMGPVLDEKRNVLYSVSITADPANFDAVYDTAMDDYLMSGGQAIIDEHAAKMAEALSK